MRLKNIIIPIVIIITIPIIINLIMLVPSIPNISIGGKDAWIGFYGSYLGSILSGLITLYVLVNTLKHNEKLNNDNKKIGIMPYFNFELDLSYKDYEKNIVDTTIHFGDNETKYSEHEILIRVKNIGLGTAVDWDIRIEDTLFENQSSLGITENRIRNQKISSVEILPINKEVELLISINNYYEFKEKYQLILSFSFKDLIGTKYIQKLSLILFNNKMLIGGLDKIQEPKEVV